MRENYIKTLGLESRTGELKLQGESEKDIAAILSHETKRKITPSCVHRYLAANDKLAKEAIQSADRLKVKAATLELDTIEARQRIIQEIQDLSREAQASGDIRTAIIGLDKAVAALDSLDKRLGKFTTQSEVQVDIHLHQEYLELKALVLSVICPECRNKLKERLSHEIKG